MFIYVALVTSSLFSDQDEKLHRRKEKKIISDIFGPLDKYLYTFLPETGKVIL